MSLALLLHLWSAAALASPAPPAGLAPPSGTEALVVETGPDGRLSNVVASADLRCSPDRAFALVTAFDTYPEWMYGVDKADVESVAPQVVEVEFVLRAPGPNVRFRGRFQMDPAARTVTGAAVGRQLRGSVWTWSIDPLPGGGARATRSSRSRSIDDNWLLDMLGEHKHVLDLGINLSTPVLELQSLRARCDG